MSANAFIVLSKFDSFLTLLARYGFWEQNHVGHEAPVAKMVCDVAL